MFRLYQSGNLYPETGHFFPNSFILFLGFFHSVTYHNGSSCNDFIPPISAMSTLKRFYRNVLQNHVSFISGTNEERIHTLELESHLATTKYGNFTLTDAVRPSFDLKIIPEQGYKGDRIKMRTGGIVSSRHAGSRGSVPILVASVSLEYLFDTFLDMLDPLGETVNIVLETSHSYSGAYRTSLHRDYMDLPVLKSFLYDHEELLLNDGCTGISIHSSEIAAEVRFDEHKLLIVCAKSLSPFEKVLHRHNIPCNETMKLLTDAEHVHITRDEYFQRFKTLQVALGMDESYTAAR